MTVTEMTVAEMTAVVLAVAVLAVAVVAGNAGAGQRAGHGGLVRWYFRARPALAPYPDMVPIDTRSVCAIRAAATGWFTAATQFSSAPSDCTPSDSPPSVSAPSVSAPSVSAPSGTD